MEAGPLVPQKLWSHEKFQIRSWKYFGSCTLLLTLLIQPLGSSLFSISYEIQSVHIILVFEISNGKWWPDTVYFQIHYFEQTVLNLPGKLNAAFAASIFPSLNLWHFWGPLICDSWPMMTRVSHNAKVRTNSFAYFLFWELREGFIWERKMEQLIVWHKTLYVTGIWSKM